MLATITANVLAVRTRESTDGKTWATAYLLQEGRQDPVQAYYAVKDLQGTAPQQGDAITAEVTVYPDRNGRLAVRLDVCEVNTASAKVVGL